MTTPETVADPTMEMKPAPPGRGALIFVLVTVALDMVALGIIAPVFAPLVVHFMAGDTPRAAALFAVFGTSFALMQFAGSPVLGVLSDRFGRKPIIVLSNLGLGLDYVVMALAPNLAWLFVGRVVSGITSASATAASAYIADVIPPEKRAGAFGMFGAAFGFGFIIGPAIGGFLGTYGDRVPFWAAAVCSLLNALYGIFVLPESLSRDRRKAFTLARANPLGSLRLLRRHRELSGLATTSFLSILASVCLQSTFVLYAIYRYHWDSRMIGLSLAFVGISSFVVQAAATGPLVKRLGERKALYTGLVAGAAGLALYGLAANGILFFIATPILMFWGLASAAAQQVMTRHVAPNEQGELQGAIGSLRGLAFLIGPAIFSLTLAAAIGPLKDYGLPGAPWFLAALVLLAAAIPARAALRADPAA
ncbi:MAG TPA: TCR/Tet family MFS transporter [Candidatus Elarobacter sp.]|jgi:DHA1 family tetracycline resistance protein-like MFS transporter